MLYKIKDFEKLSEKELVNEINQQLSYAEEKAFDNGILAGIKECIARMLESGTHPKFIAKITDIDLEDVLEVKKEIED